MFFQGLKEEVKRTVVVTLTREVHWSWCVTYSQIQVCLPWQLPRLVRLLSGRFYSRSSDWLFYRAQGYETTTFIAVTVDFFKMTDDSMIESQF